MELRNLNFLIYDADRNAVFLIEFKIDPDAKLHISYNIIIEFGLWRSRPIYEQDSSFLAPAAMIIMMIMIMIMIPEIGGIIYTDNIKLTDRNSISAFCFTVTIMIQLQLDRKKLIFGEVCSIFRDASF